MRKLAWLLALTASLSCSEKPAATPPATAGAGAGAGGSEAVEAGSGGTGGSAGDAPTGGTAGTAVVGDGGAATGASGAPTEPPDTSGTWVPGDHGCPSGVTFGDPASHAPQPVRIHDGVVGFLEGPVWLEGQDALYYTNFLDSGSNGRIRRYQPDGALQEIFIEGLGVNGMAVDGDGLLVAGFHQEQRVLRIDPATQALLDVPGGAEYQGLPLNSVNDVVARADGQLYFTDPTYQRGQRPGQPVNGAYHLTPAGVLTLIDAQDAPNGIALSPDGRTLYVAGTGTPHPLMKYDVLEDGSVTAAGTPISDQVSDGMAVDCAGNLYLTTGGSSDGVITVLSPEGTLLGSVSVEITSGTTNAAFGGPDYKTLFVTTNSGGLFEIPMVIPGLP